MKPTGHDMEAVIREALCRYDAGRLEHGQLDIGKDDRDFVDEAIEEMLDAINYCIFVILKLRRLKGL